MRQTDKRLWRGYLFGFLPGLLLGTMLVGLSACDLTGAPSHPAASELATATAAARATAQAGGVAAANLPAVHPDDGWVAEVEIADGSQWDGSGLIGTPGSGMVSMTEAMGYLTVSKAAEVRLIFSCVSVHGAHSSVTVGVGDAVSGTIQCTSTVASTRDQMQLFSSLIGTKQPVTVTVATDGANPLWNMLVEQPK
jgi:hypothetical protein